MTLAPTLLAVALAALAPDQGVDRLADCNPAATQAEPEIAIDPADAAHVVVASIDWGGGAQLIKHAATFDGGATWTCGRLSLDPGFILHADPELVFDAHGGVLLVYLAAFGPNGNSIRARHSGDGGLTWSTPIRISSAPGDDKPKAAVCRAAVAHQGRIAVSWMRGDAALNPQRIMTAYSDDDGRTWSAPQTINDLDAGNDRDAFAADLAFASDGDLFVMFQDQDPREVRSDRSADGGVTWGADVVIAPYVNPPNPLPGFSFDLKPVFAIAVDDTGGPYDGRIYVAHHTWQAGPPAHADVLLSTSSDDGTTWSSVVANAGDTASTDQCMPDVCVDPWGGVDLLWLDRRGAPGGTTLEIWGGRSLDGGATVVETRLSDAPFDPATDDFGGAFIGHYNSIEAHRRETLALWADCRTGAASEDLFLDRWNPGLTPSTRALSAATGGRVDLAISPGPNLAGVDYLVLATMAGTTPPFFVDGVELSLVWDDLTTISILWANSRLLPNSAGVLGADGTASAALDTLGPFDPSCAGEQLDFIVVFFAASGDLLHATAPERVDLVP